MSYQISSQESYFSEVRGKQVRRTADVNARVPAIIPKIAIGIRSGTSQITMRISTAAGSGMNLRITPPIRSSLIDEWFDIDAYQPKVEVGAGSEDISRIESRVESEIDKKHNIQHFISPKGGENLN